MSYSTLSSFYQTEIVLKFHHGYSLTELYSMFPYERDFHIDYILSHLKSLEEKLDGR